MNIFAYSDLKKEIIYMLLEIWYEVEHFAPDEDTHQTM